MEFDLEVIATTKPWIGKVVAAKLTFIDKQFAILSAPELPVCSKAFLHVSQYSNNYTESLEDTVVLGEEINVLATRFNRKKEYWEVSAKLAAVKEKTQGRVEIGEIARGIIKGVGSKSIRVDVNAVPTFIPPTETSLLMESGLYSEHDELDVKITGLSSYSGAYACTHSGAIELPPQTYITLTVLHIEQEIKINEDGKHGIWTLYGYTDEGILVGTKIDKVANPQERLSTGTKFGARVIRKGKSVPWLHWVELDSSIPLNDEFSFAPKIGERRIGTIKTVVGYGAFLSVWDRFDSLLHRNTIINDTTPDLYNYLNPGDKVEVEVKEDNEAKRPFAISFVRLVESSSEFLAFEERAALFDLEVAHTSGKSGGFVRSAKFKRLTLEVFDHTCIFCAKSQTIGVLATAAEAAHIVPRSKRGIDDISNAACMCKIHHWAFDRGFLGISRNRSIIVSQEVIASTDDLSDSLKQLEGNTVFWPNELEYPSEAFSWHERNVFKIE